MNRIEFHKLLHSGFFFMDGAMGTMLQKAGLAVGECPEIYNITKPETVQRLHEAYFSAGSMAVTTNTFGANRKKAERTGYPPEVLIEKGVFAAKRAAKKYNGYVALDIGPIGELLAPMGTLRFEEAYDLFAEQAIVGERAGADFVVIETMTDLQEMRAALLAVKEKTELPVVCTMSFERDHRTFTGCDVKAMALTLTGLGADAVGINCSLGPKEIYPIARELCEWTNLPIAINANAGLPVVVNEKTVFPLSAEEFAEESAKFADLGVTVLGGCCGTTPESIRLLVEKLKGRKPVRREKKAPIAVCSAQSVVALDRPRVIGERINPTGKKRFQQALIEEDLDYVIAQAIDQERAGAAILDVNVGIPQIDEASLLPKVVTALSMATSLPLQIDSTNPIALEAALRVYSGIAIVNSVSGERSRLEAILPLVQKYGAMVVALTLDEKGIPKSAKERLAVAEHIVEAAAKYGISAERVIIDPLTLTVSAEQENAWEALEALRLAKARLGVKTVLGVSNISFGMPRRDVLNQAFLSAALASGLDLAIMNPNQGPMMEAIAAHAVLANYDKGCKEYLERFAATEASKPLQIDLEPDDIESAIASGLCEQAKTKCAELLCKNDALSLINDMLIPILDRVGERYERGDIFLPQLIRSAEAAKAAFDVIREQLAKQGGRIARGTVVLATVKGDVHDIGKNIVKAILQNYGYDVLDLGKDVPVERIVTAAREHAAGLVGLSALMTTTVPSMSETIDALRKSDANCKVVVGGAVLTKEIADQIGADFYAKDARAASEIAAAVFADRERRE